MFGYKLIKKSEIDNLKLELEESKMIIDEQNDCIVELLEKIKEQKTIIANLTELSKIEKEANEEKPIKKVRRKKKTTKIEE